MYEGLQGRSPFPEFSDLSGDEQKALAYCFAELVGFDLVHIPLWLDGTFRVIEGDLLATAYSSKSIYLYGEVGPGKTAALSGLAKMVFIRRASFYPGAAYHTPSGYAWHYRLVTHHDLIDGIHEDIRENGGFFEACCKAQILIIDDIGAGHDDLKGFHVSKLEQLIDHRWGNRLTTWISGNLSPKDLRKLPGWERIYSRMGDTDWMDAYQLVAWDRRLYKSKPREKR